MVVFRSAPALGLEMNEILDESLEYLRSHLWEEWGDRTTLDVFNRLLAKNLKPSGWTKNTHANLQREQIASRKEQWKTDDLSALPRGHQDSSGVDVPWPIILVEHQGLRVLDGNHRINRWVALNDQQLHIVHIHTITGSFQLWNCQVSFNRSCGKEPNKLRENDARKMRASLGGVMFQKPDD
ncbi:hypothetical protein BH11PSE11_BH11PSE11_08400 [soil metagenome]